MSPSLALLALATALQGPRQAPEVPQPGLRPDGSIDNTIHAAGTPIVETGRLGHVERRGRGPVPLVLIPGAGFGWRVWEEFMRRNADRYTMYAITPAGYDGTAAWAMPAEQRDNGVPDYRRREWSDAFVEAVVSLVQRERLDRPVIVGHHVIGDYLSIRIAADPRARARGLIVVAGAPPAFRLPPNADPQRPGARDSVARDVFVHGAQATFFRSVTPTMWRAGAFPAQALSWRPDVAERLKTEQLTSPMPIQIRYYLEYMTADVSAEYAALPIPVVVIPIQVPYERASEQMRTMLLQRTGSDSAARRVYALIARGYPMPQPRRLKTVPIADAGVFVMLDRPNEFDGVVKSFVEAIR